MGYKNAIFVLPDNLIMAIQKHIDGEYLYIPRKVENKKASGISKKADNFMPNETLLFSRSMNTACLLKNWRMNIVSPLKRSIRYCP